ncbi:MAG: DNA polymerase III subunit delta [Anaerolineae bacterium]|nr:DNA polymerase III subunit delta [Gemmatimonadaceae bacterium]
MSLPDERAFSKALKTKTFKPVYYFYGEDEYLKAEAVHALIDSAVEPTTRDFNLDVRSASDLDGETVGSLLGTPPMMAERRVVVIRDVASLKKDARASLDLHLSRVPDGRKLDLILVLVAQGGEKAKVDKGLEHIPGATEFAPLSAGRVPKWIAHHAREKLHAAISPAAIQLLHRAVGNDLPALAAELDKLASYAGDVEIDEAAVVAVVGIRRDETLGDFLDCIAAREAPRALDMLSHVLALPKISGVSVVMALTTQMLAISHGVGLREQGLSNARIDAAFWDFIQAVRNVWRPWGEARAAWSKSHSQWDADSVDAALEALLRADIALKETRVSSDEQILSTLVIAMCSDMRKTDIGSAPTRALRTA